MYHNCVDFMWNELQTFSVQIQFITHHQVYTFNLKFWSPLCMNLSFPFSYSLCLVSWNGIWQNYVILYLYSFLIIKHLLYCKPLHLRRTPSTFGIIHLIYTIVLSMCTNNWICIFHNYFWKQFYVLQNKKN